MFDIYKCKAQLTGVR